MFARRSIQSFVNALDSVLITSQLIALVDRLNLNNRDSVAAEWEICILFGLMQLGQVTYEPVVSGKSCPDLLFRLSDTIDLRFIADITLISDAHLEEENPIGELTQLVATKARKLGISGAFSFKPGFTTTGKYGAYKVQLSIPRKRDLQIFVRDHIVPHLRSIARSPAEFREINITHAGLCLILSYVPGQRFSLASYRSYRDATKRDSNPLFNCLEYKRKQLRDALYKGCKGIIVCDGGCELLTKNSASWDSYSKEQILTEFFRKNTSISFVLLLWVEETRESSSTPRPHKVNGQIAINPRATYSLPGELKDLLRRLPEQWPQPIQTGEDSRLELEGYGPQQVPRYWGRRFGSYKMGIGPNTVTYRMSVRELMEILSGRRTQRAFEEENGFADASSRGGPINPFENALRRSLTVSTVKIEHMQDRDDDWIEFRMTGPDPALAPFQVPPPKPE
jgi:hypothetical protein